MIIAVASEGTKVTEHFGHCENFNIYSIQDNKIVSKKSVANPGHRPGFLPNFLHDLGVNVIISGGMGGGAIDIFLSKKIEVVTGARGQSDRAVEDYLTGDLISDNSICHQHKHYGDC